MKTRTLFTTLTVVAMLSVPAVARAGTSISMHEVTLGGDRSLAGVSDPTGFHFVGLHWRGSGQLEFRIRRSKGTWGPWIRVDADAAPDPGTREARWAAGWRQGEGVWTGVATRLQVRAVGQVSRARAYTVSSPVSQAPRRRLSAAEQPGIVSRAAWAADETIVREQPGIAGVLRFAVVHHTAGGSEYTAEQAPAVVRAIQLYHVQGNGWADIGYNALVDRFGTVYEGRAGGLDRNVVGAHAKGFNTGSFGIALLGEFTKVAPTAEAIDALVRTLAWRLDLAHVDSRSSLTAVSGGNEKFAAGVPVPLHAITSHRDTGSTACPGDQLYPMLGGIAEQVALLGLPKLYEPVVTGSAGETATFSARLSEPLAWTVSLIDPSGIETVVGTGQGEMVTAAAPISAAGSTRWRIDASGILSAGGAFAVAAPAAVPAIEGLAADPVTIAPDGDGTLDTTTISFTLPVGANVTVAALDPSGAVVVEIEAARWRRAGRHEVVFDGLGLPDGAYAIRVLARTTGGESSATVPLAISRALRGATLAAPWLSPNGDGHNDLLSVRVELAAPANVTVRIEKNGHWVANAFAGLLSAGPQVLEWDGSKRRGRIREGEYVAIVEANDGIATLTVPLAFGTDWTAPRVRLVSLDPFVVRVGEPGTLRLKADGARWTVTVDAPGEVRIPLLATPRRFGLTVTDAAGNVSVPIRKR